MLYDVTTLYFETHEGDGFRESGFSKERRLEPQITVGLLTDATGLPLIIEALEGNKAETATMFPTLTAFMKAHHLSDITVADADMVSEANRRAIEAAGLSFILGARTPDIPYVVGEWRRKNPGTEIPDGHVFSAAPTEHAARCTASTSKSAKPRKPLPGRSRSNATGSSPSPGSTRA